MLQKCGGAANSSKGGNDNKHNFMSGRASASGTDYPFTTSKSEAGRPFESDNLTLNSDEDVETRQNNNPVAPAM
jgi:hypothetical protein